MKKIISLYKKHEEILNYLIFGVLTTIISIASYAVFTNIFNISILISNVLSWILSVLFAFVTNKLYVFKSENISFKDSIIEAIKFYASRLFSLGVESFILYIGATVLHINDMIVKIFAQVLVIVLNYILSKIIVFKKDKKIDSKKLIF